MSRGGHFLILTKNLPWRAVLPVGGKGHRQHDKPKLQRLTPAESREMDQRIRGQRIEKSDANKRIIRAAICEEIMGCISEDEMGCWAQSGLSIGNALYKKHGLMAAKQAGVDAMRIIGFITAYGSKRKDGRRRLFQGNRDQLIQALNHFMKGNE